MQKVKEVLGMGEHAKGEQRAAEGTYGTGMGTSAEHHRSAGTAYTGGVAGTTAGNYTETAYGSETRTVDVPVVQQTTTTTAAMPVAAETRAVEGQAAVCGQEFFTKTEDRPVVKERVEKILEHNPVEKEFVVETRATGVERELGVSEVEHLGTTERIISVTPPGPPCS